MKFRKIFTFIFILCTIFGTLFVFTPITKAVVTNVPPDNLTNVTVTVPVGWTASADYGTFSLNGTINGINMSSVYIGFAITTVPIPIINGATNSIVINNVNYTPTQTLEFFFIDGIDTTNEDLIQWFANNNAIFDYEEEPEPDPTYTISGQYQFNNEVTWLYDTSEQEGILYLPFYVYNLDNSMRVNYDYMLNDFREDLDINYFFYANENDSGVFTGQYAGTFSTSNIIRMFQDERIIYFYTSEVSEEIYNWLLDSGEFIDDPTSDPNNPNNPDSDNNPNNPNNPDFGTDTVRQIVNQVNAFLSIQLLPGLSFRDILLISLALPILMYILKVFLGG